jgi:hypothetical protein
VISRQNTPARLTRQSTPASRPLDSPEELSSDEDDEFFEAIESGAVPVTVEEPIASPGAQEWPEHFPMRDEVILPYEGYNNLRTRLPISVDDRPSVSLWGILKNSIGKDLTKISFPVSFNEPTSMLQRMAEDMEFSECLDAAVANQDSTKRIAYVAAFAMSNYSSTIGRIAKPFNPMLVCLSPWDSSRLTLLRRERPSNTPASTSTIVISASKSRTTR